MTSVPDAPDFMVMLPGLIAAETEGATTVSVRGAETLPVTAPPPAYEAVSVYTPVLLKLVVIEAAPVPSSVAVPNEALPL
jgi:hypothetical protein